MDTDELGRHMVEEDSVVQARVVAVTLTKEADGLTAGQYKITEVSAPAGYTIENASQVVTVLPNNTASSTFTFYNVKEGTPDPGPDPGPDPSPSPSPTPSTGTGSIRKVDSDSPTVGIPGAVIKLTSVKLDDGGSFTSTYTTGDGGYIAKKDLDFSKLPTGSYVAEEITPPQGYILSSDVSKVKQAFTWDGEHDISLVFENSSKVKVQLKKVDEAGKPLAGAIFVILRDGKVIETKETDSAGTITVSNVSEGYYEFREVSASAGYDCDRSPVGVHVNAEDLPGEQTTTVEIANIKLSTLRLIKTSADGTPLDGVTFRIARIEDGSHYLDRTTQNGGEIVIEGLEPGVYSVTETATLPSYILDTTEHHVELFPGKTSEIRLNNDKRPTLVISKTDKDTGKPVPGVTLPTKTA